VADTGGCLRLAPCKGGSREACTALHCDCDCDCDCDARTERSDRGSEVQKSEDRVTAYPNVFCTDDVDDAGIVGLGLIGLGLRFGWN